MVTWATDGTMAGYDPITKRLKADLFHFASPGTVDLEGQTRLEYTLGPGIPAATYPNTPNIKTRMTYSAGDYAANGATSASSAKKLGMGVMFVAASRFPDGHVPTPSEVFNSPIYEIAQRSLTYSWGTVAGTYDYPFNFEWSGAAPNNKFWVLLYPSVITNLRATWSRTNDAPVKGSDINVVGRVISFWANRTPDKPVITSPVSGSSHLAGSEFTLTMTPNDPDAQSPTDASKYNADVAGVHFQYRSTPTGENPNPDWLDLPFDWAATYGGTPFTSRDGAWFIRGDIHWNGLAGDAYHTALVDNLGCSVVAGAIDKASTYQPGKGALPTGEWQIRGRTFDFGHPYPGPGNVPNQPGPLGINPANDSLLAPAKDTYPAQNTSPWSDPIRVSIPTQVPPPIGLTPSDDLAVSGNAAAVRLRWKYRNTHLPARDQYLRKVQIRKVGDAAWSTIFDGPGSADYVDLPLSMVQPVLPPLNVMPDGDFEDGSMNWSNSNSLVTTTSVNSTTAGQAHSGSRFLKATTPASTVRPNEYTDDFALDHFLIHGLPLEYTQFSVENGWFWIDATNPVQLVLTVLWANAAGEGIYGSGDDFFDTPYLVFFVSKLFTGPAQWRKISDLVPDLLGTDYPYGIYGADTSRLTLTRPPDGVDLYVNVEATLQHPDPAHLPTMLTQFRLDDLSIIATPPALDDFTMSPTNHYEWRVQVTDTDGVLSGFSTPTRFWMVPGGASGDVRPIPSSTIEGATLGCGTHRVEIFRRGGKRRVGELRGISHVDWNRARDDISTAQIDVSGWDVDCGKLLAQLQSWAYEVVIHRDNGFSSERVWEGPITLLTYEKNKVTIHAKDVMGYAYRRIIRQAMSDAGKGNGTTVVDRARRVLQTTMAPDDPNVLAYLQVIEDASDAMQYRSTPAYARTAFEEVDDMAANAGLDYTCVGRAILLWGTKNPIGTLPTFRDENLGASPIVSEYGMNFANRYSVSDGNGAHGEADRLVDGEDPDYGLVEMLSSTWASDSEDDSGTYTQEGLATVEESFKGYAEKAIADRYPPPVVVRIPDGTTLNPNTPISIQHLVPGVAIPLLSVGTLRTVADTQKLDMVKVVEEGGKETISVTMSPFSNDAALTDGGDA